jgi:NADH-quinone oxidoreductase subunit J
MLIIFYILAVLSVLSALYVVFTDKPVYSVLGLIFTMICIAGQYILMNAQFLAAVHIIVYAGAIMVLFLFVLMLLNLNNETEPQKNEKFKFIGTLTGGMLMLTILGSMRGVSELPIAQHHINDLGLVKNLGKVLFTDFVIPFEISSILFLAAMVGAVLIGKNQITEKK